MWNKNVQPSKATVQEASDLEIKVGLECFTFSQSVMPVELQTPPQALRTGVPMTACCLCSLRSRSLFIVFTFEPYLWDILIRADR